MLRHPLPRARQLSTWDCGLACAEMVLLAAALPASALAAEHAERSVWTVDLAVLLAARGLRGLALHTAVAGVAEGHARLDFYERLDRDRERVPLQFERLSELAREAARVAARVAAREVEDGTSPTAHSLAAAPLAAAAQPTGPAAPDDKALLASLESLRGLVQLRVGERLPQSRLLRLLAARRAIFISLVDARFLHCSHCSPTALTATAPAAAADEAAAYRGHFVVLTGFDGVEIEYVDPNSAATRCFAPPADVERARSSEGTDDDVIEILDDDGRPALVRSAS